MAGCQRRKQLNGSAKHEICSSEVSRTRKEHVRPAEDCFIAKPHVTLEWDANKKRVIATKEQVGISWRSVRPFFDSLPCGREILADTFDIPREIFDLDNLEEVLSQEVWQTCLSESERKYLMQFLPVEAEVQQIVKPLFAGDNFQFGNPLLQWGISLRSGHMHPDAVVAQEHRLKAEKKTYYADLRKYHIDIIGCLLKLKDNWGSCIEPKAVSGKIWRSKKDIKRKLSSSSNGFVVEEGVAASSESSSWVADERTDNCNSAILKGGKSHKRMKKAIEKDWGQTFNSPDDDLDLDLTAMNGDKTRNTSALSNNGAKYMSCIKISKKQHEIAKNMEKSGDFIHSKSLGPLLGDLKDYQIQPYEVFLEEERKKLNEHWLSVAKDLPSIYAAWRNHQLNKDHIIMSLKQELKEKLDSLMEEMEETSEEEVLDPKHEGGLANSSEEKGDIEESILACLVDKNDDGGLDVHANDEDSERGSQHYRSEQEATENYGEVEVNSEDPIVSSSLDPRGFFTRKNTSTMDENTNSSDDPGSAVDLRGQVSRNNAAIMEENVNPGDDSLCNPSLELPLHDQLLKEVLPSGANHSNGFGTLDFEFQNNQVTSKPENALQPEIRSPFSAELSHTNIVNRHGDTLTSGGLTSGGLKSQKNQITFRSEDSSKPLVSAYSPRLSATNMIISHGVPLASGGLEAQSNQITLKPEDAPKPEAVSVYSTMPGLTNVITSHGVPLTPSGFEAQRNQIMLNCEDDRKPDGVSVYSVTSHGVPLASSGLNGHKNQITLELDDARRPIDVLAYSARLGPTKMITSRGVPIVSAGIEVPRNQMTLKSQYTRQPGDISAYSARFGPTSMITSHGVPIDSAGIEVQRNQVTLKSQDAQQLGDVPAYSARLGPTNIMNNHGVPLTSNSDIWQPVSILHSGYNSTLGFSNCCTNELTRPETLIRSEHPGQWNNVGCSLPGDAELLQGQTNQGSMKLYPEQDQNDLLQSIFKGQGVISYNHEQKYAGLNFQQSNSMLMGNNRFSGHFKDQRRLPLPMEQGHKAENAIYMQQNVMDNGSSNLGSFPQQGQEQLLPPNIQDWPMNSVRFPESLACSIPSGDLSSQNWFAGERYVRGGWTASDANCGPSESLGNLDQSLHSVLSPCNLLHSSAPYDSIGSADQFIPVRSYEMVGGRNISGISKVLPHSVQSLTTNALVSNDTGWINLPPQQNPRLNDVMEKPFMGSWDQ